MSLAIGKERFMNRTRLATALRGMLRVGTIQILQRWETAKLPLAPITPMTADYMKRVLDTAGVVAGHQDSALENAAINVGSHAALATVAELIDYFRRWRDAALQSASEARQAGDYDDLEDLAGAIVGLSAGLLEDEPYGAAIMLLGQVARARGDTLRGLGWYDGAQKLGESHNLPATLCGALDGKGNCLASMGRLDEADKTFARAYDVAPHPGHRVLIAQNWALALADAGRVSRAAALLETTAEDHQVVELLPPLQYGVLVDNLAAVAESLGDLDRAQILLTKARPIFDGIENRLERAKHAILQAGLAGRRGDVIARTSAFVEAHDLMLQHWRSAADVNRYIEAFSATLAQPDWGSNDSIAEHMQRGLDLINTGRPAEAIPLLRAVFDEAEAAKANYTKARAAVHVGIALKEAGNVEEAHSWLRHAAALGREIGDARVEMQALKNLASLGNASGEIAGELTGLSGLLHILALEEILPTLADVFVADAQSKANYLTGIGGAHSDLAEMAASYGAIDLARYYFAEALRLVPEKPQRPEQAVSRAFRLASKVTALPEDTVLADLEELEYLATTWVSDPRVVRSARCALGLDHLRNARLVDAVEQLRAACAPGEEQRRASTPQQRVDAGNAFDGPLRLLAKCHALLGNADEALQASQAAKGRYIVDVLDARASIAQHDGAPLDVEEIRQRMDELFGPSNAYLVDVGIFSSALVLVVISMQGAEVRVLDLPAEDSWKERIEATAALQGPNGIVKLVAEDPILTVLAKEVCDLIPEGMPVLACLDSVLQQLPLQVLLVDGLPWCERNGLSLLPAVGLLRHISSEPTPRRRRSFVAGDSRDDLPGANAECLEIAGLLETEAALASKCTVSALHAALVGGPLDVLHLAVHGIGDRARGRYSGLVMADANQGGVLVPFEELISVGLDADLVVLSGCSTAVAGPLHRSRMAGVAVAAIESGARSVIGCLWPVNDIATKVFMVAFYRKLVSAWDHAPVDLRTCMEAGRAAVRDWAGPPAVATGKARDGTRDMPSELSVADADRLDPTLAGMLAWAPFVLIGDPVLFG